MTLLSMLHKRMDKFLDLRLRKSILLITQHKMGSGLLLWLLALNKLDAMIIIGGGDCRADIGSINPEKDLLKHLIVQVILFLIQVNVTVDIIRISWGIFLLPQAIRRIQ